MKKTNKQKINIFFDIETFQYLENDEILSREFSVAYAIENNKVIIVNSFYDFFEKISNQYQNEKINLIAFNSNRFDNFFIRRFLLDQNFTKANLTTTQSNPEILRFESYQKNTVYENFTKSKGNLSLEFYYDTNYFYTKDIYPLFQTSLRTVAKQLLTINELNPDEIKTDFDYAKFKIDNNNWQQAQSSFFKNLNKDELKYITNDVLILQAAFFNIEKINGLKINKNTKTLSQAVIQEASKDITIKQEIKLVNPFSDFEIFEQNYYDFLKKTFKGGLNIYNDKFILQKIKDVIAIDKNSEHPYSMYNNFFPGNILKKEKEISIIDLLKMDQIYIFQIKTEFFNFLMTKIKSIFIRKALVKYFNSPFKINYINLTNVHLKLIFEFIEKEKIDFDFTVENIVFYTKKELELKKLIADEYIIKTEIKKGYKIINNDLNHIQFSSLEKVEHNQELYTKSKIVLNTLYGATALREFYTVIALNKNNEYEVFHDGVKMQPRNLLIAIYTTANSLAIVLSPLKKLNAQEIDDNVLYIDTDSLFLKREFFEKRIRKKIEIDDFNFNAWKVDKEADEFFILNNKKYSYIDSKTKKLKVTAGGIPQNNFNLETSHDNFIKKQFSPETKIQVTKSHINQIETITIQEHETELTRPDSNDLFINQKIFSEKDIKQQINAIIKTTDDEPLYFEIENKTIPYDYFVKRKGGNKYSAK